MGVASDRPCGRLLLAGVCAVLALAACASSRLDLLPSAVQGATGGVNRPEHRDAPYLVLVSIDGFRPVYLDRFDLPNFTRVVRRGVRARAMIPVFPSFTFPNHYSLVTGLHANRHGIVSNHFYDPARRETYSLRDRDTVSDATWYRGEPIWVTAERQGMVAGCYFWPGSEAAIRGVRPTYLKPYDESVPNEDRVRTVLGWLEMPVEARPHLVTLYFSAVDTASHERPPDDPAVEQAAAAVDRALGLLLNGVEALPIRDRVHVLLTSDHGMVETSDSQTILLDTLVDRSLVAEAFGGPVASLHVTGGAESARRVRDAINARLTHGRAYLREELPARYHYSADPRVGDVVVVMDESWMLATSPHPADGSRVRGMHGWDPALASMHALFVLAGPGIPAGVTIGEVRNVDVYPMMTELLGIDPAPDIDGRPGAILSAIRMAVPTGSR